MAVFSSPFDAPIQHLSPDAGSAHLLIPRLPHDEGHVTDEPVLPRVPGDIVRVEDTEQGVFDEVLCGCVGRGPSERDLVQLLSHPGLVELEDGSLR